MEQLAIQNKEIQLFNNQEFGSIRTFFYKNESWFIAKDVAESLGYSNTRDAVLRHVFDEDKTSVVIPDSGSNYKSKTTIINESGLYALIFGSKLDSAKRFKHWVTSEVLPSIRKTGSYSVQQSGQMEKLLAEITEMKDSIDEIWKITRINYISIDEQLTNLLDNTESNNEFISEHNEKLETAIDNMTLSTRQQEKIHEAARVRINYLLGGAHSDQYKKSCRIYFINLWNSLKAKFHCGSSWKDLNPCDFNKAVNYIGQWEYQG